MDFVKGLSGWLSPDGVFYPCKSGEHKHFAEEHYDTENECNGHYIPMGVSEPDGKYSFLIITKELTPQQAVWFKENFSHLNPIQQETVRNYLQ